MKLAIIAASVALLSTAAIAEPYASDVLLQERLKQYQEQNELLRQQNEVLREQLKTLQLVVEERSPASRRTLTPEERKAEAQQMDQGIKMMQGFIGSFGEMAKQQMLQEQGAGPETPPTVTK